MKYQQPAGKAADASYVDGNRSAGIVGDVPPAAAIEHPQREIVHVIEFSGQVQDPADLEQLRKAIAAMIAAATGEAETDQYLLMAQARARLPIFPEIFTADGKMLLTSTGAGNVRVVAGTTFQHRGIFPVTTAQTDFAPAASKTYHLRWNPTDGFALKDLANGVYNPGVLPETNAIFDSSYDDMLVARVVTSGANVPTITPLVNLHLLKARGEEFSANGSLVNFQSENGVAPSAITQYTAVAVNFARTPDVYLTAANDVWTQDAHRGANGSSGSDGWEFSVGVRPLSRYQIAVWGQGDNDIYVGWAVRA